MRGFYLRRNTLSAWRRYAAACFVCNHNAGQRVCNLDRDICDGIIVGNGAAAWEKAARTLVRTGRAVSFQLAALVVSPVKQGYDSNDNERVREQVKTGHSTYHSNHPLSIQRMVITERGSSRPPVSGSRDILPWVYYPCQVICGISEFLGNHLAGRGVCGGAVFAILTGE